MEESMEQRIEVVQSAERGRKWTGMWQRKGEGLRVLSVACMRTPTARVSTRLESVISCYHDQWCETASDKAAEKYPGGTFSE